MRSKNFFDQLDRELGGAAVAAWMGLAAAIAAGVLGLAAAIVLLL